MKDRREEIREYMRPYFEESIDRTGEAALLYYREHRKKFYGESIEPFNRIMRRAGGKRVKYMVVAFLYSSILTGSRKYQIILYDDLYYLDQTAPAEPVYFRFLDPFFDEDVKRLTEFVAKGFIRLTGYEKESIKLECAAQYKNVLMYCFDELKNQIFQLDSFDRLQKEDGFKMIIGDYMGHGCVAHAMPPDLELEKARGGGNGLFSDQ